MRPSAKQLAGARDTYLSPGATPRERERAASLLIGSIYPFLQGRVWRLVKRRGFASIMEDCLQAVICDLLEKAVPAWDPTRSKWITYAGASAYYLAHRWLQNYAGLVRVPVHAQDRMSHDPFSEDVKPKLTTLEVRCEDGSVMQRAELPAHEPTSEHEILATRVWDLTRGMGLEGEVLRAYYSGATVQDIAREYHIPKSTVTEIRRHAQDCLALCVGSEPVA